MAMNSKMHETYLQK